MRMNMQGQDAKPGETLAQYSQDLTKLAREGKLDPVIGRDGEIRRSIQVLSRRTKCNPVLVGPAGVGNGHHGRSRTAHCEQRSARVSAR